MNDARQIYLKSIGDVYLPGKIAETVSVDAPVKQFGPKELSQLNKIFNHLRKGGIAVVSGSWDKILEIFDYLEKKKREFSAVRPPTKKERQNPVFRKQSNRWYERHYQRVLAHVMVISRNDGLPYVDPDIHIPRLLQLLGEPSGANGELPFLVPVSTIQKIQSDMKRTHYVSALETDIAAHGNVLQPLSQDTIELFREGLQGIDVSGMNSPLEILDMGCGCGVLSLLAAKVFAGRDVRITATDILPEAIATTGINIQRYTESGKLADAAIIETAHSGDLFEPAGDRGFDVIMFNAPWAVSSPKSRAEIATCDAGQETVRRFLGEVPQHLREGGRVLLGYSDHSGDEALENLERMIEKARLRTQSVVKRRIQTRSQKRKWETILVYNLVYPPSKTRTQTEGRDLC